jgi:hypothetical protein
LQSKALVFRFNVEHSTIILAGKTMARKTYPDGYVFYLNGTQDDPDGHDGIPSDDPAANGVAAIYAVPFWQLAGPT